MTRPLVKKKRLSFRDYLIKSHQAISHSKRIHIIANTLIEKINAINGTGRDLNCLDIGCGDMNISRIIANNLPGTSWQGIDIYALPEEQILPENPVQYQTFDGKTIPFGSRKLDIAILIDVLHHSDDMHLLLKEAARVSDFIIIKDHFEYGFFSRWMLKSMDLYGNWAYGIKVPGKYFNQHSFNDICRQSDLQTIDLKIGMDLYRHIPVLKYILKPKWHFVAVLKTM